jgi:hypothetical protein
MREEEDLRAALRALERHAPDPDSVLLAVRSRASAAAGTAVAPASHGVGPA